MPNPDSVDQWGNPFNVVDEDPKSHFAIYVLFWVFLLFVLAVVLAFFYFFRPRSRVPVNQRIHTSSLF